MSSVTGDNENQLQATVKRLKRGDENELERNLRLEKVVASKQLKFAMEMDVERKARLEKMVPTTQLRLALETEEERKAKKGMNEFNLDLISKPFFSSRNELARHVMATVFLLVIFWLRRQLCFSPSMLFFVLVLYTVSCFSHNSSNQ